MKIRIALVTGASSSIGLDLTRTLLARGDSVVALSRRAKNIGTSLASLPLAGVPSALPILIKGGIEAATRSLAIEYASHGIRVNTIAAGIIDTPLHGGTDKRVLAGLSPAQRIGRPDEISAAVLYLDSAEFVSGEVLHVDGGAHAGKW
jgi:NAD(P)-dependent dehydrogenase (short-subunit alcohol dehydrogenase family)